MRKTKLALICAGLAGSAMAPASAIASDKEIAVAARALNFIQPNLKGTVNTVIFYRRGDAESLRDAQSIRSSLARQKVKGAKIAATLASDDDVNAASDAKVVFLARGLRSRHSAIASAASAQGAVTISSDLSCVQKGFCVIGVKTSPKVEILVSSAARRNAKVNFASAFLMLVQEV